VILGPDAVADPASAREVLGSAFAERGLTSAVAHGWDAAAVAAALSVIDSAPGSLDRDRVVVLGHSAGGQLALRANAVASGARIRPALLVSRARIRIAPG
jgi:dienelactone hydrolase